jgi:hypothetical protein
VDKCPPNGLLEFDADVYLQDEDGNVICNVPLPVPLEVDILEALKTRLRAIYKCEE